MDRSKPFDRLKKWWKTYVGLEDYIALILMIVGIFCYIFPPNPDQNNFFAFLFDFRAELLGAGIATLLIGNASQAAQIREEKKGLILQMGSPDNSFAIEAVRQLRQQGWLVDGSLKGSNLHRADLSGAFLSEANLSGAVLIDANLSGANLFNANLSGAYLQFANLSGADLQLGDLSEVDLQFTNLSGADLLLANLSKVNLFVTNLSGAKFCDERLNTSARFDENTKWNNAFYTEGESGTVFPEGFNPADHRMHLIRDDESFEDAVKRVFPDRRK